MKNVITGATGHIGVALIKELRKRGEFIRIFALKNEDYSYVANDVDEVILGDVRNLDELEQAFEGMDRVFHLAGIISIGKENQDIIYDVNVQGTKNAITAAKNMKVGKFLYTASVHAIPNKPKTEDMTELDRYDESKVFGNYSRTKAMSANAVMEANCEELKTVVAMPSGVVGPYAYKTSNIGQLISDVKNRKLSMYINGEYQYVDVRDVAWALVELIEKGEGGESYIVSGEKMTVKDMLNVMSDKYKNKRITVLFPMFIAKGLSGISEWYYRKRKVKPLFTAESLYTLTANCNFNIDKIKKAIGFSPSPVKNAIEDEIDFYEKIGK